jgi:hypothetical protein
MIEVEMRVVIAVLVLCGCGDDSVGGGGSGGTAGMAGSGGHAGADGAAGSGGAGGVGGVDGGCDLPQGTIDVALVSRPPFADGSLIPTDSQTVAAWSDTTTGTTEAYAAAIRADRTIDPSTIMVVGATDSPLHWPQGAWSGSQIGFVHAHAAGTRDNVYFSRLDSTGALVAGSEVAIAPVAEEQGSAIIAWDPVDHRWGVAWREYNPAPESLRFVLVDAAGTVISSSASTVNTVSSGNHFLAGRGLIWNGSQFALAWSEHGVSSGAVKLAEIGTDGQPVAASLTPVWTGNFAGAPTVTWNGSGYGIAWAGGGNGAHGYFARVAAGGGLVANSQVDLGSAIVEPTFVVWDGTDYRLVWSKVVGFEQQQLLTARIDAAGSMLSNAESIGCSADVYPDDLVVAAGKAWLLYHINPGDVHTVTFP